MAANQECIRIERIIKADRILRKVCQEVWRHGNPPMCQATGLTQCHTTFVSEIGSLRFRLDDVLAPNMMKKQTDLHRSELNFQERKEVYLMLRLYRQRSLERKRSEKPTPKFYGSYYTEKIRAVACRLELPPEASIHKVFHVSQLKLELGQNQPVQYIPPRCNQIIRITVEA